MSRRGTFRVDRGVFDHPVFADEDFTEREAWLWLVAEAAYRPRQKAVGRTCVTLQRGQLAHSTRFMASRWGWSEARVRRFLGRLKGDAQIDALIDAHTDAGITLISICKYEVFQLPLLRSDAANDAQSGERTTQTKENKTILSKERRADAPAVEDKTEDARTALFRSGLGILRYASGRTDQQCRTLIGKWLKKADDDARRVLRVIEDARDNQVADPVSWIEAALKANGAADVGSYSFVFGRH